MSLEGVRYEQIKQKIDQLLKGNIIDSMNFVHTCVLNINNG